MMYEPHEFKCRDGIIGGGCITCTYPVVAPWHRVDGDGDLADLAYVDYDYTPQPREYEKCRKCEKPMILQHFCQGLEKMHVLDALYNEYGAQMALVERTTHNTRINNSNIAAGILRAIRVVEAFE